MKKNYLMICVLMLIMIIAVPVYAADAEVIVSKSEHRSFTFETTKTVVDVAVVVEDVEDIYAFSLSMDFDPNKVSVEAIGTGNIFSGFKAAQIKNVIDADNGTALFMQTLLATEKGVDTGGTLCVIRLALPVGSYDLDQLGLNIQLVNSVPEYLDVKVSGGAIIVEESPADQAPAPTPTPFAADTGMISVSEAEAEIAETELKTSDIYSETNPQEMEKAPEQEAGIAALPEKPEEAIETYETAVKRGLPTWLMILVSAAGVLLIGWAVYYVFMFMHRKKHEAEK